MLGNDVVDLQLAKIQSDWQRKNYLAKVFSPAEQQFIHDSNQPDGIVWLMWSMKEAIYKIVNRNTGNRFYNPLAFQCSFSVNASQATGSVIYSGEKFLTCTEMAQDSIHTLGFESGVGFEDCKVVQMKNLIDYKDSFNQTNPDFTLQKNKSGLPEIYQESTGSHHVASLSHHGGFLYLAYLIS